MANETTQQAVGAAKSAAESASERAAQAGHKAANTLSTYADRTEQRLRETGRIAGERTREYANQVSGYVAERPLTSIAVALGLGLLFGLRIRGR